MANRAKQTLEALGVLSVVASLIFVGLQVQQANRIARLQVLQEHAAQFRESTLTIATSPELTRLVARVYDGAPREEFSPEETVSLDFAYIGITAGWAQNFQQRQLGVLNLDDLAFDRETSPFWTSAYYRDLWPLFRSQFSAAFVEAWERHYDLPRDEGSS